MAFRRSRFRRRRPSRFMRRGRFSRNKRSSGGNLRRTTQLTTQLGNVGFNRYRGRKLPHRRYISSLFNASRHQEHFRSAITVINTETTGAASGTFLGYLFFINDAFWTAGGGLVSADVNTPTFGGGDLFIRGGLSTLCITNTSDTIMEVTIWSATTTHEGFSVTDDTTIDRAYDPSILSDFQTIYRFGGNTSTLLKPGESTKRLGRIRQDKIDQTLYTLGKRRSLWIYKIVVLGAETAKTASVEQRHNLSFTGDMTGSA